MSFNWAGATAGLLETGGQLAGKESDRLYQIEAQKIKDKQRIRREEAEATKARALQVLGYTKEGAPVTRGDYEKAPEKERPVLYSSGLSREKKGSGLSYDDWKNADAEERSQMMQFKNLGREPKNNHVTEKYNALKDIVGEEKAKKIISGEKPEWTKKEAAEYSNKLDKLYIDMYGDGIGGVAENAPPISQWKAQKLQEAGLPAPEDAPPAEQQIKKDGKADKKYINTMFHELMKIKDEYGEGAAEAELADYEKNNPGAGKQLRRMWLDQNKEIAAEREDEKQTSMLMRGRQPFNQNSPTNRKIIRSTLR